MNVQRNFEVVTAAPLFVISNDNLNNVFFGDTDTVQLRFENGRCIMIDEEVMNQESFRG